MLRAQHNSNPGKTGANLDISDSLTELCLDSLSSDEQRALERDLILASQVQRGLLPSTDVRFGEWNIHYQYKPEGIVSGDYCDLIPPSDGTDSFSKRGGLIFLLGDVSGKGVAASLLMTHLHATFRSLAGIGLELDQLLEIANRVFCESTIASQYATLVCGRLSETGELEIASAGHLPALLLTRDGVRKLGATGVPLGLFPSSHYAIHRVQLEPLDSLLLFTDGISEARDHSGSEYGIEQLSSAVAARHGWPAAALVAACGEDVERYSCGAHPADDQTLLAVHFAGPGAAVFTAMTTDRPAGSYWKESDDDNYEITERYKNETIGCGAVSSSLQGLFCHYR